MDSIWIWEARAATRASGGFLGLGFDPVGFGDFRDVFEEVIEGNKNPMKVWHAWARPFRPARGSGLWKAALASPFASISSKSFRTSSYTPSPIFFLPTPCLHRQSRASRAEEQRFLQQQA